MPQSAKGEGAKKVGVEKVSTARHHTLDRSLWNEAPYGRSKAGNFIWFGTSLALREGKRG